jgi:hypothetical protein
VFHFVLKRRVNGGGGSLLPLLLEQVKTLAEKQEHRTLREEGWPSAASLLPLVLSPVFFPGRLFFPLLPLRGGFAPLGRTWCRISQLFDRFFLFPSDLRLGVGSRRSPVFVSFLGVFVFRCFRLLAPGFWFSVGVASAAHRPLRVFYASPPHRATTATLLGCSRPAPPGSFLFLLCFLCFRSVFVLLYFCVLVFFFFVFSGALPIFSALDLPPSVHCRAFPCNPTATSFNAPCTGPIRLLRDWLFPILLVFSVCILLLFPCITVFCL